MSVRLFRCCEASFAYAVSVELTLVQRVVWLGSKFHHGALKSVHPGKRGPFVMTVLCCSKNCNALNSLKARGEIWFMWKS